MKVARLYGPHDLRIEEIPSPKPQQEEVLIKVLACGVCGSDLRAWSFGLPSDNLPQILGHEIAGVVTERGKGAPRKFAVGTYWAFGADVNCGSCYYCEQGLPNLCLEKKIIGRDLPGGYAEYILLNRTILEKGIVHQFGKHLSPCEAALAEPLSSVIHVHERLPIRPGDLVVIFGGGPIGCFHAELSHLRGAKTALVEINEKRLAIANELAPVDFAINAKVTSPVTVVKEITDGLGADIAIVATSSATAQAQAVELVRKRGTVVFFGGLPPDHPLTQLNANMIHYGEIQIIGAFSYSPWHHAKALKLIESGTLRLSKYITKVRIDELPKIFEIMADPEKGSDIIKVVITFEEAVC